MIKVEEEEEEGKVDEEAHESKTGEEQVVSSCFGGETETFANWLSSWEDHNMCQLQLWQLWPSPDKLQLY